jgi:arylsulfatase A-like enzyme
MMTGCYPARIGCADFDGRWVLMPGQEVGLHPDEVTIATLLRDCGYATALVGKWHCGDQPAFLPTAHGFDTYYGIPYSNDMGRQWMVDGSLREWPPLPLLRDDSVIQAQPDQAGLTERYAEEAVRFIRAHRDRPFFLYLAHMYVHLPLYVPERFLRDSGNGKYGAAVAAIDWVTALLVRELRRQGLSENTLIVFTSDNGSRCRGEGGSNGPLRGAKGHTREGGMRLPCIVSWPGQVAPGGVCRELALSLDLLPTFAALAGTEPPGDRIIDGRDISALLRQDAGATSPHDAFFYYAARDLKAVRTRRWKLHLREQESEAWWERREPATCAPAPDGYELFDLDSDIGETTDVSAQHPAVVAELMARLDSCREDLGDGWLGVEGANCRPLGRVPDAQPLTRYDAAHPYFMAEYDLTERG